MDGAEYLDVVPLFASIGLRLTTVMDEFYLLQRDDATPTQRAMAAAIFSP